VFVHIELLASRTLRDITFLSDTASYYPVSPRSPQSGPLEVHG
jgi:hypothetical protein